MNEVALKALKKSISHWKRMRDGNYLEGEAPEGAQCALCDHFACTDPICAGCPVMDRTGRNGCADTPYAEAQFSYYDDGPYSESFKEAATREIEFLESLLPEGEK